MLWLVISHQRQHIQYYGCQILIVAGITWKNFVACMSRLLDVLEVAFMVDKIDCNLDYGHTAHENMVCSALVSQEVCDSSTLRLSSMPTHYKPKELSLTKLAQLIIQTAIFRGIVPKTTLLWRSCFLYSVCFTLAHSSQLINLFKILSFWGAT